MRKITSAIFLFTCCASAFAQNLVNNYSFETHSGCPSTYGQVTLATGWFPSSNNNNPQFHTEYLHACGTSMFGAPSNTWGNQAPATGQACMATCTTAPTVQPDYRENIYTTLTSPLVVGVTYNVSFKISHCDNSQKATNNFGVKFATVPNFPINNVSQVYSTAVVTDKINWTTVTGSFIADSAYTYICLGNFMTDANTTMTTSCSGCSFNLHGYYLDDVEVTAAQLPPVAAFSVDGKDLCAGIPVVFSNSSQNATSVFWDFGDSQTSTIINPTHIYANAGTYTVTLIAQNSSGSDTTTVVVTINACVGIATNNLPELEFTVVPNPGDGHFELFISGNSTDSYTMQVFDTPGKLVKSLAVKAANRMEINLSGLPAGVYFLKITGNGASAVKRLIIR